MPKKAQHVTPRQNGWSVRRSGASRASGHYATQAEAVEAATRIARNQGTEVYIHGRDGRIREHNSYADDAFPPRR